jgi:uncharacterized Zn finger protein (UPF0148 family)
LSKCPHCGCAMRLPEAEEGDVYACPACELELELRGGALTLAEGAEGEGEQEGEEEGEERVDDAPAVRRADKRSEARGAAKAPAVSATPNRSAREALRELPEPAGPEVEILRTCPAYWRVSPFACAGTTFAAVLGVGLATMMAVRGSPAFFVGVCVLIALINVAVFAHGWLRTKSTELRITNKRIIDRDGILTRHISEVLHKDIKSVRVRQTLWQRARGIGELAISTDGDEGPEIYMACVTEPKQVQKIIDHYRL